MNNLKLAKNITESKLRLFYDETEKLYFLAKNTGLYSCLQLFYAEKIGNVIAFMHNNPLEAGFYDPSFAYSPEYKELSISV